MISINTNGSFKKTESALLKMSTTDIRAALNRAGNQGVAALIAATPVDSGLSANSWGYQVRMTGKSVSIVWTNSNVENGFPVAIALQYGYATGTGGYVSGRDYINSAIRPVFDQIAADVWREVTSG